MHPQVDGANPVSHLINRQVGNNISNFRRNLFRERLGSARNLFRKDLVSHYGCVNAIEFSSKGDLLISGGDDRRVLLWKLEESIAGVSQPTSMKNQHYSNIFCLGFNNDSSKIFSGGNDEAVIVHDVNTGEPYDVFLHSKPVYGLSVDVTNDQIFATASEDGHILIFDLRIGTQIIQFPSKSRGPFHACQFHPSDGNCMITANNKEGAALWDLRDYNQPIIRYDGGKDSIQSCMSVRFNTHGTQVLALRRRLPPILYNTLSQDAVCQFYHPDYYNSCTMKSCCFAGVNDEYVISGSDDFNLYMWRVNDADCKKKNQWIDSHHMVLYGHRSIVNQVRYNPQRCLIASSGVEKVIKIFSPFELEEGGLAEEPNGPTNARDIFSHEEYVSLLNSSGQNMTHDYSHQSTSEDPRMMAFFDSLVQREIEGWNSNDNSDSDKSSVHSSDESSRRTSTLQSESDETFQVYGRDSWNRNRATLKSRSRYLNRIAYLIATKRNTLKRLALKGSGHTTRRVKSLKCSGRKLHRSSFRQPRKTTGKRINRLNTRTKSRDCNGNNSESELPKKLAAKRRQQLHFNVPSYRPNRRVNKAQSKTFYANYESGDSSSDDENLSDNNNSLPSSSKTVTSQETTNANNRTDFNENRESTTTFPIPSTSTGITANGTLFRVVQTPDSDDEPEHSPTQPSSQSVNQVAPIKMNGTHTTNTRQTYSSGVDDEQPSEVRHSRRKRNHSLTTNAYHYTNYSSHSSSRLSNSSSSDDDDTTSNDSAVPFFSNNLIKKPNQNGTEATVQQNGDTSSSSAMLARTERTPIANRSRDTKNYEMTPDSGIASTPGSSTSSATQSTSFVSPFTRKTHNNFVNTNSENVSNDVEDNEDVDDNHNSRNCSINNSKVTKVNKNDSLTTSMKLYQQSMLRVRRNFRNIGDASYSEDSE